MKFSVLMSVFGGDRPADLMATLESLLNQDLVANELVLVEDGPVSDNVRCVIERFRKSLNIVSPRFSDNRGLGAALNYGLKCCRYDIVARMDSDDLALPHRFKRQVEYLEAHPDIDIVGSYALEVDECGVEGQLRVMPLSHEAIVDNLWACPLIHPTVVFRATKIAEVGGYRESLRRRQDYALWFDCAAHGLVFANIPETLLYYRFGKKSHGKQSCKLAFEQGLIGFKGAASLSMPWHKRIACFIPFVRALLPGPIRHKVYRLLGKFDPRSAG